MWFPVISPVPGSASSDRPDSSADGPSEILSGGVDDEGGDSGVGVGGWGECPDREQGAVTQCCPGSNEAKVENNTNARTALASSKGFGGGGLGR